MSGEFSIPLPADLLDEIAERAASLAAERLADASTWMTREEAARYLRVPKSRLEKDKRIPRHPWDGRILYHRAELDEFLHDGAGR